MSKPKKVEKDRVEVERELDFSELSEKEAAAINGGTGGTPVTPPPSYPK